ncbi:MAG: DEAD/DEAH box helicase family protein, partial [Candidatus Moranbacteria bacterium]|nr:DEAD/DEAH box helicase family protein [Candidatus Moranbacteria bacterium]
MSEKILTTKIKLPEFVIEKKKVGKNQIVQLAQHEEVIGVEVYKDQGTTFLLKDRIGRKFFLKMPNSKVKIENENILKVKDISAITDLNENSKLVWENNLFEDVSKNPEDIVKSWNNVFHFREEKEASKGLRKPQLGGIHAISSHWSVKNSCGTLVMPTGTGNTETMISALLYEQCGRVLIVVPSKVLRHQMFKKFLTLGCLRNIGVIDKNTLNPRVILIEHGIKRADVLANLVDESNVIIATSYALNNFPDEVKEKLAEKCTHLFIDEAHHVPAKTW